MSQIISQNLQQNSFAQRYSGSSGSLNSYRPNLLNNTYRDIILNNLAEKHGRFDFYYSKIVDKIVKDAPNQRIVAIFKDFLIFDDCSCECLRRLVPYEESKEKLKKLSEFYNDYADIFPSYALLLQPCEDEKTLILKEKEGMAKYMYKNIRRKQRVIDEMYSIVERNKRKDANHRIESNQLNKQEPRRGYKPTRKNQNEMFFTPSFLNSVIKFEKIIAKKERITYLRKLTFQMSIEDLLDQFIEKDSQQIVTQENFYCGRVIEPLHLVDNVYHIELERDARKKESSKQRQQQSKSRSKSPIDPFSKTKKIISQLPKLVQINTQKPRAENIVKRMHYPSTNPPQSHRTQQSRSPATHRDETPPQNKVAQTKNQISQLRTPREIDRLNKIPHKCVQTKQITNSKVGQYNLRKKSTAKSNSKSPQRGGVKTSVFILPKKSQSSPVRTSIEKRSPMKNIQNLVSVNPSHQILKINQDDLINLRAPNNNLQKIEQNHKQQVGNLPPSKGLQSPSRQIRKSSIASHNALSPSKYSQNSTQRALEKAVYQQTLLNPSNKSTSLMLGQSIKMLLKANKQNQSTHYNQLSQISEATSKSIINSNKRQHLSTAKKEQQSTQFETPSKNTVRSREVSGSKGRLQRQNFASQNLELFSSQITNGGQPNIQIVQTSKFMIPEDEDSQILEFSQIKDQKQTVSRIRESLIKKTVTKAAYRNAYCQADEAQRNDDQIISMNFMKQHQKMKQDYTNGGT